MADSALCGDIVRYANRVISASKRNPQVLAATSMELFEIMACQITGEASPTRITQAYQEHDEAQAGTRGDPGLNLKFLCGMNRSDIPLLVAYELCHKRKLQLEPPVGWGHWLNQFHAFTGMMAQPYELL